MNEFEKSTNSEQIELKSRHIREMGALFAKFLDRYPEIDPNFADDTTKDQELAWNEFNKDMRMTQQIELYESIIERE